MAARQSPTRTPPAAEAEVVHLVREGQTRGQVAKAVGVHPSTVSRIVRDTEGLEFARTGSGSSGTPEAAAKARGYRSAYMRDRREKIADKLLNAAEKAADQANAMVEVDPRKLQALMQAADASMRAYASVTKGDILISEQESMQKSMSMLDVLSLQLSQVMVGVPVREGLIQE